MTVFFAAALSLFHYINVPAEQMRESPSSASEIVSQALFSEEIMLLEDAEDWIKIETAIDHYQGWVKKASICSRTEPYPPKVTSIAAKVNRLAVHLYTVEDTTFGPLMTLPFESKLQVLGPTDDNNSRWLKVSLPDERQAYIQRGDITFTWPLLSLKEMCDFSLHFLGLPYTWGGRSSFGYDCSGFVQMLYRQMGLSLPRDSKDQMRWEGFKAVALDSLCPGDLIFFGPAEDKIRHVVMYLKDGSFIHSTVADNTPYIRISHLDEPRWNGTDAWGYRAARRLK